MPLRVTPQGAPRAIETVPTTCLRPVTLVRSRGIGAKASGGARVASHLLAEGIRLPRAIVCANDQTALGVMHALLQHGIDVPGEVAVTGFDDIPVARHLRPQLTTVRQPIAELGAMAFDLLRSMIASREPGQHDIVLPTRLMRRESCGCPPAATRPDDLEGGR